MSTCHIALGSNLGNRERNIQRALDLIASLPGTRIGRVSRMIETAPVGGPPGQGAFLNAAAEVDTQLEPLMLLEQLQHIERQLGRQRRGDSGPRAIDLDILLWGAKRLASPELSVPHRRMHYRRFVIEPLFEIAPEVRHPDGWTIAERWERLRRLPHYLAITGPIGVGKTTVARRLARELGADLVEERFDASKLGRLYAGDRGEVAALQAQFLASRRHLLDPRRSEGTTRKWVVSDFWFGQSLAFARVLLSPDARAEHEDEVWRGAAEVLEPTLVVWLDGSPGELAARITARGRKFERPVDRQFLAKLRDGYRRALTEGPGLPLYRATGATPEELINELLVVASAIAG